LGCRLVGWRAPQLSDEGLELRRGDPDEPLKASLSLRVAADCREEVSQLGGVVEQGGESLHNYGVADVVIAPRPPAPVPSGVVSPAAVVARAAVVSRAALVPSEPVSHLVVRSLVRFCLHVGVQDSERQQAARQSCEVSQS
jgi:hypothetical protein